jgi:hypothetical protein
MGGKPMSNESIVVFKVKCKRFKTEQNIGFVVVGDWIGTSDWHNEIVSKLDTPNWISFSDQCSILGDWSRENYNQGVRECEVEVDELLNAYIVNKQNYVDVISTLLAEENQ